MTVPDRDANARAPAHWRSYAEGTVLLDPVTWQTHCLSPDALPVLDSVREILESGVCDRDAVLDQLIEQSGTAPAAAGAARENLRPWVDLALHLYAAR